jgi:MFS family permease
MSSRAFTLAYAPFQIPGGWLGDRFGPKKVLMRVVLWWSFFTAATGWAWSAGTIAHRSRQPRLDRTGSWNLTFYISSAVYLAGAVCWMVLDAETPLDHA